MVPLRKYRPDVPYAMVTAEFPRVRDIARESAEDRIYHLVPRLWAAWSAARVAFDKGMPIRSLQDLDREAAAIRDSLPLEDLDDLLRDLLAATVVF